MRRIVAVAVLVAAASAAWLVTIDPDAPRGPIAEADWIMPAADRIDRYPPDNCHPDVPGWQTAYQAPSSEPAAIRAWYRERHGAPVAATEFSVTYEAATVWIFSGGHVRVRTYASFDHCCPPRDVELWDRDPVTVFLGRDGDFISVDAIWYGRDGEPVATLPEDFALRAVDVPAASLAVSPGDPTVYVNRDDGAWLPYTVEAGFALTGDDYGPWLDIDFPGRVQRFTAKLLVVLSGLVVASVIARVAWLRRSASRLRSP